MKKITATNGVVGIATFFMFVVLFSCTVRSEEYKVNKSLIEKLAGPKMLMDEVKNMISIMESVVSSGSDTVRFRFSRNIFYPSVRISSGSDFNEEPSAAKKKEHTSVIPDILGVVIGRSGSFVIFKDKEVKEGDKFGEIKVVSVSLDRIVLETDDGLKKITLE